MIDKNASVKCPWCSADTNIIKWNDLTYSQCINREMKRDFIPITNEKVFKNGSVSFYMCPKCSKWSRGSQLILIRPQSTSNK